MDKPHIIVLLGMMGVGKSRLGVRLAERLKIPFFDTDAEIEKAVGLSIADVFAQHGEAAFREREQEVIARLLQQAPHVLALGGGAFMHKATRALIEGLGDKATTIWLDVPLDELAERLARKPEKRPLLAGGNLRQKLARLMTQRAAIYAQADIHLRLSQVSHEAAIDLLLAALGKEA